MGEKGVLRFVQSYVPDWLRQAARALGTLYLVLCTLNQHPSDRGGHEASQGSGHQSA